MEETHKGFRQLSLAIVLTSVTYFGSFAHAGNADGGGGKGVVCRNPDLSVRSVELLELWESRTLFHRPVVPATGTLESAVDATLVNLKNSFTLKGVAQYFNFGRELLCENQECLLRVMRASAKLFLTNHESVRRLNDVNLELTDDSKELASPANCSIEQIVNYQPSGGFILINQDLYEKMDLTNQTALIAHEALYEALRFFQNETNSIRVRRAIGYVFSGQTFKLVPYAEAKRKDIVCVSPAGDSRIVFSRELKTVDFSKVMGQQLMGTSARMTIATDFFLDKAECTNADAIYGGAGWDGMGGPVEFDRSIKFHRGCVAGKSRVLMLMRAPGEKAFTTHPLACSQI